MDVSEEPAAFIIKVTLICRPKQAADQCPWISTRLHGVTYRETVKLISFAVSSLYL